MQAKRFLAPHFYAPLAYHLRIVHACVRINQGISSLLWLPVIHLLHRFERFPCTRNTISWVMEVCVSEWVLAFFSICICTLFNLIFFVIHFARVFCVSFFARFSVSRFMACNEHISSERDNRRCMPWRVSNFAAETWDHTRKISDWKFNLVRKSRHYCWCLCSLLCEKFAR